MLEITNRWALVTGASRGIGREIALFLAKKGINLVVHSRTLNHTDSLMAEIQAFGVKVIPIAAELSDESQVRKMAEEISSQVNIDILFNNAGIQLTSQKEFWNVNADEFLLTYQVNVIAPMIFIEAFLPGMLNRKFGRIINTTSGIKNQPEQGAYAASKGALDKLTKDMAGKLIGTNVLINVADPGWIRTDLGGSNARHAVETVVPGMAIGAFVEEMNGKWISAQEYSGMSLDKAVLQANKSHV